MAFFRRCLFLVVVLSAIAVTGCVAGPQPEPPTGAGDAGRTSHDATAGGGADSGAVADIDAAAVPFSDGSVTETDDGAESGPDGEVGDAEVTDGEILPDGGRPDARVTLPDAAESHRDF